MTDQGELQEEGTIDDERFAQDWAYARWHSALWSPSRLQWGLQDKGVSDEIASRTVSWLQAVRCFVSL